MSEPGFSVVSASVPGPGLSVISATVPGPGLSVVSAVVEGRPGRDGATGLAVNEILGGTPDGTETDFTASQLIAVGSESVAINGIIQARTLHYTIAGAVVTFDDPLLPGEIPSISYSPA